LEKSLLVLQEGVTEGRKIFANITKYIKMGASSNFGNMFSVLGASLFLPFLPMLPIHVLTNNLLYDFSQTAIPTDNVDEDYIAAPRRWDISNIFKFMVFIGPISSIFDHATYAMMAVHFRRLEQSFAVPDRVVRGIAADADADHPHHPHRSDSVHREPCEPGHDRDDGHHLPDRDRVALHLGRRRARLRAAAHPLLAAGRCHDAELCGAYASGKGVVRAPLGDVRRLRCVSPASLRGASSGRTVVVVKAVEVAQPASPR
jgi:hypothetical protein